MSSVADLRVDFDAIQPASAEPPQIPAHLRITRAELTTFLATGMARDDGDLAAHRHP